MAMRGERPLHEDKSLEEAHVEKSGEERVV
jgi:hypothetical protein